MTLHALQGMRNQIDMVKPVASLLFIPLTKFRYMLVSEPIKTDWAI